MPKYTEFDDISGEELFDRVGLGARMFAERNVKKRYRNAESLAAAMRSEHHVNISARQYLDMEAGKTAKDLPAYLRFDVFIAFVEIIDPPGGRAFAKDCMSDTARRVLGIE